MISSTNTKVLLVILFCASISTFSQVVKENDYTVEFIGLKHWTIDKVRDSLKAVEPGTQLGQCAVPLKYGLHFADVSVELMDAKPMYFVVTVIEPQDSNYVKRTCCFSSTYWIQELIEFNDLYRKNTGEKMAAISSLFLDSAKAITGIRKSGLDTNKIIEIRKALLNLPVQISRTVRAATKDYNPERRQTAIIALSAHPENDSSWYALIKAMRDISDINNDFAGFALNGFAVKKPRQINWSPAYDDLRMLFNGSNLFQYATLLKVLSCTGYNETDFRAIFNTKHSRELLVAKLQAKHPKEKQRIIDFLKTIKPDFEKLSETESVNYIFSL